QNTPMKTLYTLPAPHIPTATAAGRIKTNLYETYSLTTTSVCAIHIRPAYMCSVHMPVVHMVGFHSAVMYRSPVVPVLCCISFAVLSLSAAASVVLPVFFPV